MSTFSWLLFESNSPLSPPLPLSLNSLSLHLSLSLEGYCHKISSLDPEEIFHPVEPSKSLPNIIPPSCYPPSKIGSVFQKEPLCWNRDIPTLAILPTVIQLSDVHWDILTTSCELRSKWFKFGFRNQNLFNPIHMKPLSIISFPVAAHRRKIRSCGFAG